MWASTTRFVRAASLRGVAAQSSAANNYRLSSATLHHGRRNDAVVACTTAMAQCICRQYSVSSPASKIIQIGGDKPLSEEEKQKLIEEELAKMEAEAKAKEYPDWKPGQRKRPLFKAYDQETLDRDMYPERFVDDPLWTRLDRRCGALAIKLGMMPVWDEWGLRHPCTVLWLDRNIVIGNKTMDKHGYSSVCMAAGERKAKNVPKTVRNQYSHVEKLGGTSPYLLREFRVSDEDFLLPVGTQIHARHFVPGQNIDVSGITKGKGFQGAMKRHGFAGMPATHGTSLSHRALGSTGQCQDPGKVFKGKKMAGRMGGKRATRQNMRIIKIDRGSNLLYVRGDVPGNKGEFIEVRDAIKKPLFRTDKVLGSARRPPLPTFEYDDAIDGSGVAGHEEFMPTQKDDPLDPDYMDTTIVIKPQL